MSRKTGKASFITSCFRRQTTPDPPDVILDTRWKMASSCRADFGKHNSSVQTTPHNPRDTRRVKEEPIYAEPYSYDRHQDRGYASDSEVKYHRVKPSKIIADHYDILPLRIDDNKFIPITNCRTNNLMTQSLYHQPKEDHIYSSIDSLDDAYAAKKSTRCSTYSRLVNVRHEYQQCLDREKRLANQVDNLLSERTLLQSRINQLTLENRQLFLEMREVHIRTGELKNVNLVECTCSCPYNCTEQIPALV